MQIMETPSLNISSPSLWWTARTGGSGHLRVLCSTKFGQVIYRRQLHFFSLLSAVSLTRHAAFIGKDDAQHDDWSNGNESTAAKQRLELS
jgi:hypothetical protein